MFWIYLSRINIGPENFLAARYKKSNFLNMSG